MRPGRHEGPTRSIDPLAAVCIGQPSKVGLAQTHAIAGRAQAAPEVPWFWSDQYDIKLQIAGLPQDADRTVVRGDPATRRFAVFHLCGDRIVCVEAVSAPPEFMAGKQLIGRRTPVDIARLIDPAFSMKEVALQAASQAQGCSPASDGSIR